ncbi:diphthamide biosynthesis protein 4 [Aspergillus saccharolyticus JOP 1030-1]|uniref:Diphthamide biosynthesis protein 4 n=1 Tax=Aspergillus saccharolyticus JOP 1030-1 TaxID=1450539 RepID=A0A318Z0G5_9EURO|nr:DnaJ-domain-containing protein [Aspergillus saccharolyticus JOP 1030-1]PYH40496.1 DnaJ-domain-containing protein [Aspergillus saccharolyticus JOP 1030-1]
MTLITSLPLDYYEILSVRFTSAPISKQELKSAYHRALLKHHPDKAAASAGAAAQDAPASLLASDTHGSQPARAYTIDEITAAYKVLSDPSLRAEYDRTLRLDRARAAGLEKARGNGVLFHTGLEVVDLEDLSCEEGEDGEDFWYRGCRCGDERGFLLTERDLEKEAENGEIVVGCRGCSLWMKVLFAVEDDHDAEQERGA